MKLPGWKHVAGSVYEHASGVKVHLLGGVYLPDGGYFWSERWPDSKEAGLCIRICGGNRRRGLMLWAMKKWRGEE